MRASFGVWIAFLLFGFHVVAGQETSWLTDEQARDVVAAVIRSAYPQPCYSTYRNERLEDLVVDLRRNPIVGNRLNNSVYFYRVASDSCDYVVEEGGKPVRMSHITMDCCEYGTVAVDRATARSYWFAGGKSADIFQQFARDERVLPDSSKLTLFIALYRALVLGESSDSGVESLGRLREVVQRNFQSAYSPYERDNVWQRKFERWWQRFQSNTPRLRLETTYETTAEGTEVRGYVFKGFELTIPRSDPPPKGTPGVFQWALLVKPDGTVERLPSKVIYSAR